MTPAFKKLDCMNKEIYRLVSLCLMCPKYRNNLYNQLNDFMKEKLSVFIGFRKGHSAQHSLLIMTKKWRRALDKNIEVAAIFMDLSKVFDTLNHRLILAKLRALVLQPTTLKQMENYLAGRVQRTKIGNIYI